MPATTSAVPPNTRGFATTKLPLVDEGAPRCSFSRTCAFFWGSLDIASAPFCFCFNRTFKGRPIVKPSFEILPTVIDPCSKLDEFWGVAGSSEAPVLKRFTRHASQARYIIFTEKGLVHCCLQLLNLELEVRLEIFVGSGPQNLTDTIGKKSNCGLEAKWFVLWLG